MYYRGRRKTKKRIKQQVEAREADKFMAFPKRRRIEDPELLRMVSQEKCCINNCRCQAVPAHIKSVGSGGDDTPENISPLCFHHHTEQHSMGWPRFRARYPEVITYAEFIHRQDNGLL